MSTPTPAPKVDPQEKAMILQAVTQLDLLISAFAAAPDRVKKAAKEFQDSLKEWANGNAS